MIPGRLPLMPLSATKSFTRLPLVSESEVAGKTLDSSVAIQQLFEDWQPERRQHITDEQEARPLTIQVIVCLLTCCLM
jgi:hypothetical protein